MKPANAKVGGTSSKKEREGSAHISTTRERSVGNERVGNERVGNERVGNERVGNERVGNERGIKQRDLNERSLSERAVGDRALSERALNERALNERWLGERGVGERLRESKRLLGQRAEREGRRQPGTSGSTSGGAARTESNRRSSREESERPSEEPRTGVVRRVNLAAARPAVSGAAPRRAAPKTAPPSGEGKSSDGKSSDGKSSDGSGAWRCLEWGERPSQRPPKRHAKVSVAQLSTSGQLIRQDGPDAWLPEAGDFVHRMALLVAQGLGFDRCRAVCLRGANAVLSVSEAGATKVVAVTGPVNPMSNVLRRMGLE